MKHFLVNLLIIGVSVLMFYPLLLVTSEFPIIDDFSNNYIKLRKGGTGHLWTRLRDADTTRNIDVLILGSSLAYRGIDTRNFKEVGITAFNLGSSSQTPLQTQYLLNKYLEQLNPETVIWDINPTSFGHSGIESFIDLIYNCDNCTGLEEMLFTINSLPAYNSYLKSTLSKRIPKEKFIEPIFNANDHYIPGGYVETQRNAIPKPINFKNQKIEFIDRQTNVFRNSLILLKKLNINVILIISPKMDSYLNAILNKNDIYDYFWCFKEEGLINDFWIMNEINPVFKKYDAYFYDSNHLSKKGVELYNRELIELFLSRIK